MRARSSRAACQYWRGQSRQNEGQTDQFIHAPSHFHNTAKRGCRFYSPSRIFGFTRASAATLRASHSAARILTGMGLFRRPKFSFPDLAARADHDGAPPAALHRWFGVTISPIAIRPVGGGCWFMLWARR